VGEAFDEVEILRAEGRTINGKSGIQGSLHYGAKGAPSVEMTRGLDAGGFPLRRAKGRTPSVEMTRGLAVGRERARFAREAGSSPSASLRVRMTNRKATARQGVTEAG
jgi:hypothetical protein